jgi:RNA polymerase sigma-70 factor, ECF subfamily
VISAEIAICIPERTIVGDKMSTLAPVATRSPDPLASAQPASAAFQRRSLGDVEDRNGLVALAIARGKEGDRDAIRYLYVRYADNVYGYLCSIVRDEHEAEDLTQDVFAKLLTSLHKYEPRDVPFAAWLLRVARNIALDHMRQRRTVLCEEVRNPETALEDTGHQRALSLDEALGALPADQRRVLILRHVIGLSPGEIASFLGKTEGSVHALHHRGRCTVRGELERLRSAPAIAHRFA